MTKTGKWSESWANTAAQRLTTETGGSGFEKRIYSENPERNCKSVLDINRLTHGADESCLYSSVVLLWQPAPYDEYAKQAASVKQRETSEVDFKTILDFFWAFKSIKIMKNIDESRMYKPTHLECGNCYFHYMLSWPYILRIPGI